MKWTETERKQRSRIVKRVIKKLGHEGVIMGDCDAYLASECGVSESAAGAWRRGTSLPKGDAWTKILSLSNELSVSPTKMTNGNAPSKLGSGTDEILGMLVEQIDDKDTLIDINCLVVAKLAEL